MKHASLKTCLLGFAIALASVAPGVAQGDLDAGRDLPRGLSEGLDPEEAAILESALLGGVSPLVVPAADFTDDGFDPGTSFFGFGTGQLFGGSYGCSMAPVYLPDGATVTFLFATVHDSSASNILLSLHKRDNFSTTVTTMATAASSSTPGLHTISAPGITSPTVLKANHSVFLFSCFTSGLGILSARIYFLP